MTRSFARLVGLLSVVSVACSPAPRSDLLDLSSIGPTQVDEGTPLVVEGDGFPTGREGTLRLVGVLHRPGAAPAAYRRAVPIRASSASRAELAVDAELLQTLGGRGTFEGRAELAFEAAHGGTVRGALDATLDLGEPSPRPRRVQDAAEANALLSRLGVTLGDDPDALVIESLEPVGAGAGAGLRVGDRIVSLGGLRPRSVDELRPAPGSALELGVERGEGARAVILVGAATQAPPPDPLIPALLALLVLVFVTVGPGARVLGSLRRVSAGATLRDLALAGLVAAAFAGARLDATLGLACVVVVASAAQLARGLALGSGLARLTPLGLALVVATLARGEIALTSSLELSLGEALLARQPLTALPFVASLLVLAPSPEGLAEGVLARALPMLARAIGATWVGVVFGLPTFAAPLLAWGALSAPFVPTTRLVPFSLLAAGLSGYFLFELDTSRPVESLLDPRATLWLALGAGALLTIAGRLRATPRAHLYL
ncbi:MAG: hypothetical protein KF901_04175 [Myxococcales bacterium]|nr:hypothetical protein [Myxococcales bacterium]